MKNWQLWRHWLQVGSKERQSFRACDGVTVAPKKTRSLTRECVQCPGGTPCFRTPRVKGSHCYTGDIGNRGLSTGNATLIMLPYIYMVTCHNWKQWLQKAARHAA